MLLGLGGILEGNVVIIDNWSGIGAKLAGTGGDIAGGGEVLLCPALSPAMGCNCSLKFVPVRPLTRATISAVAGVSWGSFGDCVLGCMVLDMDVWTFDVSCFPDSAAVCGKDVTPGALLV